ncbi:MAG: peptide deformylase [Candidatus Kerfeldbacteria bacterium]|nr:peptide deformylase [Candidatus Kerfeldbacteria bacterium]
MQYLLLTQLGDPVLRAKNKKLSVSEIRSNKIQKLIADMFYTVRKVHGVGLAAPQVGKNIQLAIIDIQETPTRPNLKPYPKKVIINPRIIEPTGTSTSAQQKTATDWEGCLSFNTIRGTVTRPNSITVEYLDEHGTKHTETVSGFPARVFQHEIDHLRGFVFIDRMKDMRTLMTLEEFINRIV